MANGLVKVGIPKNQGQGIGIIQHNLHLLSRRQLRGRPVEDPVLAAAIGAVPPRGIGKPGPEGQRTCRRHGLHLGKNPVGQGVILALYAECPFLHLIPQAVANAVLGSPQLLFHVLA